MKYAIMLTCGTENASKAVRCFQLATVLLNSGNEIFFFLVDEAVNFAKPSILENTKAITGDELLTYAKILMAADQPIYLCKPCCATREIRDVDLPKDWSIGGMLAFAEKLNQGYTPLIF